MSIFKSYKPRRYISVDKYQVNSPNAKRTISDVNGKLHQFRELCSNCKDSFGNHGSRTDVCPTKK